MDHMEKIRYQEYPDIKVGLVVLDRKRPWPAAVNPETGNQWADDNKEKMLNILEASRFEVFRCDINHTVNDDRSLRAALRDCSAENVDVIVAIQPTISDGRLAPVLAQQWGPALVFWASPEEQTGEMISGNSLVGTHLMVATLRQLGRQCQFVYGNLDWSAAERKLVAAVHQAHATRYIQKAKLAIIGHQAPGFVDFHPNPPAMSQTFGTILQHVGLAEYLDVAKNAVSQTEVDQDVRHVVNNLKLPFKDVSTGYGMTEAEIQESSRHYLAMKRIVSENNFDGLAIRCWPELPGPQGLSSWCYMALARLATEGFPIACEGDVEGSLGCLVGKLLGCGAIYLSDWLEHDDKTLTLWHGGMAPFQLSEAVGTSLGPCISRHFNNKVPGCLDATIKIGIDVTIFRFWVFNNRYQAIVFEGRTIAPKRHLLGNNGLVAVEEGLDLSVKFDDWLEVGFPHHICVVEGRWKDLLLQFARSHNVKIVS